MQKIIVKVDEVCPALLDGKLAEQCYVVSTEVDEDYCRRLAEKTAAEDKLMLLYGENAVVRARTLGADGVVLDLGAEGLKEKIAAVRRALGKNGVVGLVTRNRRHESMIVSEAEPDFVVFRVWKEGFDKIKELTDWYNDFFLIQSAAWIMEEGVPAEELRTDFVIK